MRRGSTVMYGSGVRKVHDRWLSAVVLVDTLCCRKLLVGYQFCLWYGEVPIRGFGIIMHMVHVH